MAKFPVEVNDSEGIVEGLNYVLSGPSGLGQNFAGFSSWEEAYLTGNFRTPFAQPTSEGVRILQVAPIAIATTEFADTRTIKVTFASPQPTPPFQPGNQIYISGSSEDWYDGGYSTIGVVSCTTTECFVRLGNLYEPFPYKPVGTGGTIKLDSLDTFYSTDCNARVTVTGATDRVFISGQLDQTIEYELTSSPGSLTVIVEVNRYRGYINSDPVNPDFLFDFDETVAKKVYNFTGLSGTTQTVETVFSTILDQPTAYNNDPLTPWTAYYWYILEVSYESPDSDTTVNNVLLGLRSLSAQVVKQ